MSQSRIKSRTAAGIVHLLWRTTSGDLFTGFHRRLKGRVLHRFIPALEGRLQHTISDSAPDVTLRLVPRHGIVESEEYNFFVNDVDLSIVSDKELPEEARQLLVEEYQALEGKYPFLGELQILSEGSLLHQQSISEKSRRLFGFLTDIRKIASLESAVKCAHTSYHRQKAYTSAAKVIRRSFPFVSADAELESELQKQVIFANSQKIEEELYRLTGAHREEALARLSFGEEFGLYSPYFDCRIEVDDESASPHALLLSPSAVILLLALSPPGHYVPSQLWPIVRAVRLLPNILVLYRDLLMLEWINACATAAGKPELSSGERRHLIRLHRYVTAYRRTEQLLDKSGGLSDAVGV